MVVNGGGGMLYLNNRRKQEKAGGFHVSRMIKLPHSGALTSTNADNVKPHTLG